MTGLKEWADKNLTYEYIVYPVVLENIPSRKIPESLGGKEVLVYTKTNQAGLVFSMVEYHIYPTK